MVGLTKSWSDDIVFIAKTGARLITASTQLSQFSLIYLHLWNVHASLIASNLSCTSSVFTALTSAWNWSSTSGRATNSVLTNVGS